MADFVKVTKVTDVGAAARYEEDWVNLDNVTGLSWSGNRTVIRFTSGKDVWVRETPTEIMDQPGGGCEEE